MSQPAANPPTEVSREARLTLIGIMLGLFLAALDQTIVSTALPRIIADLNGTELYAWVTTAYLLASTIAAPIFGRLTELYSRKTILLVAIAIFLGGSALCGLSQNMTELILFRGIQGIGGGALFALALTTIALLFPPRDRGRVGGLFGAVFGISSAVGPWLGGLLTDAISWHWVFYINMPVGAIAVWFILRYMPVLQPSERQRFDFLGAGLLIVWTVPLLLAFSWGGADYAWSHPLIIGLFGLSASGLALWIWSQLRNPSPLFDLSVLRIRSFSIASVAGFFFGPAFLGAVAFLPLYLQVVKGVSAASSGVTVLPLTLGVVIGAVGSGILSGRMGRFKPLLIAGSVWLLSIFLLLWYILSVDTPLWVAIVFFLLLGLGLGPAQSLLQIAAQNNLPPQRLGSGTAATQFIRQIGATIGIAILGTVLANTLQQENCKVFPNNAACQPGAVVQRSGEAQQGVNIDQQFKDLENQVVAALKGDTGAYQALMQNPSLPQEQKQNLIKGGIPAQFESLRQQMVAALKGDAAAYQALMQNPNLPTEYKSQLVEGGLAAQVAAQNSQTIAALRQALQGNAAAKQTLLTNPNTPTSIKGLLSGPQPPATQVEGIVQNVAKGLEAATPQIVAQLEAQILPQIQQGLQQAEASALQTVPAAVVLQLENTKEQLKTALSNGITQAEKSIFLIAAMFVAVSLVFILLLPNDELKGGGGFGGRSNPAAH